MQATPLEKFHSLPNVRGSATASEADARKLYSLSLSQLRESLEFTDYRHKPSPFNIRWVHGFNSTTGVINLNDSGSTTLFYAASYFGILFNWATNQMRILQGHRHTVTCIASDAQGRWLVTADSGPDNVVIIWDATDYFPQKTLHSPHGSTEIAKVAISADAKYLLTMAYPANTVLYWWIWSFGRELPHARLEVELPKDSVIEMGFNPYNSVQFLLMTKQDIWIGISRKIVVTERGLARETNDYELKVRMVQKMQTDSGKLTSYTFVDNTCQVLVATSRGSVLIYAYSIEYKDNASIGDYNKLKFVKVLKMEKHKINVIRSVDGVIVTGNNAGEIHFYDEQMKLVYWVHGFQVDSVQNLSFNISRRSFQVFDAKCKKLCPCWEKVVTEVDPITGFMRQKLLKKKLPEDATAGGGKSFIVRDFIVCTKNEGVGFVDFVTEKIEIILKNKTSQALSLTVHPEKHLVCIGYEGGFIEMINFVQHLLFKRLDLRERYTVVVPPDYDSVKCYYDITIPELSVTCLKYSPSGLHLACGLNTGQLLFLDPTTLDIITSTPFQDTKYAINKMDYSLDSLTLAFADTGSTVGVYKYDCVTFTWSFIGKHRAHYKGISTIFFLPQKNASGDYKLLSLGADRIMVEYDIGASSGDYLEVFSLDRVDQTAVPLAGISWPTPKGLDPEEFRTDLPMILMATNQYKYKIVNYGTTMTLSTLLGPRLEHPVRWMQLISRTEEGEELQYLVFATENTIGLQKMPLDGNPWKHVGLLAHPVRITERCFRADLGILFTIGDTDSTMSQWAANYRAPDSTSRQGGEELDPYYCLIENGRPGWLFQEIRDLFYYIQILCQGTFSPAMRRVKDYIPIDSLPDLMRALGYFPSEYEVENLIVEAKYKVFLRSPATEIDFKEFVKLYLNHRPAFGDDYKSIRRAFKKFAITQPDTFQIGREDFIDTLGEYGERFSRELTWYLLSILSGLSFEERAAMAEDDFKFLPQQITFNTFLTYILGVQEMDNISELSGEGSLLARISSATCKVPF